MTWLLATSAVLLAVFAAAWSLRHTTADATPNASAATIAVLPFSVRGGESVQYLTEGIVNLLGVALDGAGLAAGRRARNVRGSQRVGEGRRAGSPTQ